MVLLMDYIKAVIQKKLILNSGLWTNSTLPFRINNTIESMAVKQDQSISPVIRLL